MLLYRGMCNIISSATFVVATMFVSALGAATGFAGSEPSLESKDVKPEFRGSPAVEIPTARESRGLITYEGPAGMFINPTSSTLPQGTLILNYCIFIPSLPEGVDVQGHGILLSYGVRDWLELGFVGDLFYVTMDGPPEREDTFVVGGPMARIRLLRDRVDKWWPELSIGSYVRLGTPANVNNAVNAFIAFSKTLPINENGFLKTITFQGGFREAWLDDDAPASNITRGYGGIEVQLPYHFYGIAEIDSRDNQVDTHVPWAAGLQWRGKWFGATIAALQNGSEQGPGFYFGVGGGLGAEPVRTPVSPTAQP